MCKIERLLFEELVLVNNDFENFLKSVPLFSHFMALPGPAVASDWASDPLFCAHHTFSQSTLSVCTALAWPHLGLLWPGQERTDSRLQDLQI